MDKKEFETRLAALVRQAGQTRDNVGCVECTACEGCQSCTFCRESRRLTRCNYCVKCDGCTDTSHSRGCSGCIACVHCIACDQCAQSAYLVRCSSMTGCTYCFGCVGLSRKDFHILNEPYDRKTYFALTQKLIRELGSGEPVRAVVQRALAARVEVDGAIVGAIEHGLVVFLAAGKGDLPADVSYLADKIAGLRVLDDGAGKMSLALADVPGAGMLVVSQFTLFGDVRRGRRPSFDQAMEPVMAEAMIQDFVTDVRSRGIVVETGRFRADMRVFVVNDGPVTLVIDSRKSV